VIRACAIVAMFGVTLTEMSRRVSFAAVLAAAVVVAAIAVGASLLSSGGGSDRHAASAGATSAAPTTSAGSSGGLVPATSKLPAAGVCEHAPGAIVTLRIEPDAPNPRCASVDGSQWLRVVNRTDEYGGPAHPVTLAWIPGQTFTLQPGQSKTFPQHFATYLAHGVHDLSAGSGYRAEIWLR
jgi:hypothetical protein